MKKKSYIPLYLLNTMNAYEATGRVITHYPYLKRISLDGMKRLTYNKAYQQMKDCLRMENKNAKL
ncbi:MAG TPA: hypothetical protein ENI76_06310 [Ignavibacteria bacterium]|nr:hypothetical protein [Ignavibacteria bacterium]